MTTVTYSIPNISCNHCVHTIQNEVADLAGVQSVKADAASKQAVITFAAPATEEKIKADTKATIRCIPLEGDKTPGVCMVTGKPSAQRVVFARAY